MRESLKDRAYRTLSRMILSGALAPGSFVNRRAVASEMGMSVAPVLEAMLLLEAEGLLETLPRRGTRVRVHRIEDVRGHFLVREALECQVAREVCGKPVARALPRLAVLARAVDDAVKNGPELWEAEAAFHSALADLVGSAVFAKAFRKAMRADLFYKLNQTVGPGRGRRRSHLRLLKALRSADSADAAEIIVRRHLREGKAGLFEGLEPACARKAR